MYDDDDKSTNRTGFDAEDDEQLEVEDARGTEVGNDNADDTEFSDTSEERDSVIADEDDELEDEDDDTLAEDSEEYRGM